MAREISFDWEDHKGWSRRQKYPWHLWANGNTWEVVKGDDFFGTINSMTAALHTYARYHGLKVRTTSYVKKAGQQCIAFQFWTPKSQSTIPQKKRLKNRGR